jgi:hypothetical protein
MAHAPVATIANTKLAKLTPMAQVADVARSLEWYSKLGFKAQGTWTPEGSPMQWATLRNGYAELMLVRAEKSVDRQAQGVLLYLYAHGVAQYREHLIAQGLKPGELEYPFYAKHGEFQIDDPDGYCLLVGDTEQQ